MKKILLLALIIIALLFLIFRGQKSINTSQKKIISSVTIVEKVFEEKENSEGEVTVTVKPLKLDRGGNTVFEVTMETHTVNLDKDLKEISVLTDDKGKEYKPISWSGELGGHHVSGDLIFPILPKDTRSVKLTIKEINNIDRVFEWKL